MDKQKRDIGGVEAPMSLIIILIFILIFIKCQNIDMGISGPGEEVGGQTMWIRFLFKSC